MKKILISFFVFFISGNLFSQDAQKILIAGGIRMNVSRMIFHDPILPNRVREATREAFTPGFGISIYPYQVGIFHLQFNFSYEERGSDEAYYFETSNVPIYLHVHDRFRCIYSDILARVQSKKGYYFSAGGSVCKPIGSYFRNHFTNPNLPLNAIIIEPPQISEFTYGITVALGKNFGGKTEIELNATYDQTPIISRTDAKVFIQSASLTVRYFFRRENE